MSQKFNCHAETNSIEWDPDLIKNLLLYLKTFKFNQKLFEIDQNGAKCIENDKIHQLYQLISSFLIDLTILKL